MKMDLSNFKKTKHSDSHLQEKNIEIKLNKKTSGTKNIYYGFIFATLFLTPIFLRNISHFGWGFIPSLISMFLIPIFILTLLVKIIIIVRAMNKNILNQNFLSFFKATIVPVVLLILSIISLIYNFT